MLVQHADDLYTVAAPQRFLGIDIGTRMTVVRLADGSLFLHSPIAPSPELRKELDALGPVRHAVGPNCFHHLFLGDVAAAYPDVVLYGAPGLDAKRRDLSLVTLSDEAPAAWAGQLDQLAFQGIPMANEVVFFHRSSRTLLLTDLAFKIGDEAPPYTRFAWRFTGMYGRLGPTFIEKILTRDRKAARASLERVLAFDFERVIVTHGTVCEHGGKQALSEGYAWLLGA